MIADLSAHELWPSPLADAALSEFRIRLSQRVVDERAPDHVLKPRQAVLDLKHQIKPAWDSGQIETFLGLAVSLDDAGGLNDAYRRRLGLALLWEGLFDRAALVYASLKEDDHHRWREQALALAGAGRLDAAAEAITRSLARLAEAPPEANVGAAVEALSRVAGPLEKASGWEEARWRILKRIQGGRRDAAAGLLKSWFGVLNGVIAEAIAVCREDSAGGAGAADWPRARQRALAWMLLGRPDQAADPLAEAAASAPELSPAGAEDALSMATIAAAAQPAEIQVELLDAAARLAHPGAARQALQVAMSVVDGADWRQAAWPDGDLGQPALALIATACARSARLEAAVAMFAALARAEPDQDGPRRELAACQSMETLARLRPRPTARRGPRRTFDLFPYNGELELLKIKLHEMAPWVDHFVLVESAFTYAGEPKPLHFDAQKQALQEFLPKLTCVVVDHFPKHAATSQARAFRQRDEAIRGLEGLWGPDDLVLLTDVDEVVDGRALKGFKGEVAPLRMHTFRHLLNYRLAVSGAEQLGAASVWRAVFLEHYGPSLARSVLAGSLAAGRIENAGWRFTGLGDAPAAARLKAGERDPGWKVCDPQLLPAYIREHWDELKPLLL